eukprot:TRINITY_DN42274_c0_g1_i1.p1 TRINITY_DN42274_c0_g1~~TRINITY_DN42274_c0_g1_i1.p1  ORF type:complete len:924 (+),score=260.23 TRINITY_DN42274_c0_g1_i1:72-2843(+)
MTGASVASRSTPAHVLSGEHKGSAAAAGHCVLPDAYAAANMFATSRFAIPWAPGSTATTYPVVAPPAALGKSTRLGGSAASMGFGFSGGLFSGSGGSSGSRCVLTKESPSSRSLPGGAAASSQLRGRDLLERAFAVPRQENKGESSPTAVGVLQVRVCAAYTLLRQTADAAALEASTYVVARLGGIERRTTTCENELNPVWWRDNSFSFPVHRIADEVLELEVRCLGASSEDEHMGKLRLPLSSLPGGSMVRRREALAQGGRGELELELRLELGAQSKLVEQLLATSKETSAAAAARRPRSSSPEERLRSPLVQRHRKAAGPSKEGSIGLPTASRAWDFDVYLAAEQDVSRPRARSGSLSRSPRSRTFTLPDDLFEAPRLDLPEAWREVETGRAVSSRSGVRRSGQASVREQSVENVKALAKLTEALRLDAAASAVGLSRAEVKGTAAKARTAGGAEAAQQVSAEQAALAKAKEKEKAVQKSAQQELERALKQLQALQPAPKAAAAPRAASPPPPAPPTPWPAGVAKATSPTVVDLTATDAAAPPKTAGLSPPPEEAKAAATAAAPTESSTASPFAKALPVGIQAKSAPSPFGTVTQAKAAAVSTEATAAAAAPEVARAAAPVPPPAPVDPSALVERLAKTQELVKTVRANTDLKDFRNNTKKAVGTRITQISASVTRITESIAGLKEILKKATEEEDATKRQFVELTVADRLADEAEVSIRAKAPAAWAVAHVASQVFDSHADVETLFQGCVFKFCPYLAADYQGSNSGRPADAPAPGQRPEETFISFADRMVGYARLWFSVLVMQDDLAAVWRWLAKTLNLDKPSVIAATMLHTALVMTGSAAQQRYGKQFAKLAAYIGSTFLPALDIERQKLEGDEADRARADESRLRVWVDMFQKTGQAPRPEGSEIRVVEEAELNPDI